MLSSTEGADVPRWHTEQQGWLQTSKKRLEGHGKELWLQALVSTGIIAVTAFLLTLWPTHIANTSMDLKISSVDLLGDPSLFQYVESAPFLFRFWSNLSANEERPWLQNWMNWRSSFLVCAELIWLIIFDTSQGRERYSGWESKNTFQDFIFPLLYPPNMMNVLSLSCHSPLMNAFPPLHFKKWDSPCNTIHNLKITFCDVL